ncbi:polysaccharide biosynthesis tyrosine autokinase [Demequina sp. NBRC 110057]|uniref:polysaccharide biosynthesis tyrosine autokinase n=1 Tax=Demequina sp. NBRC 110057 TaxID=1570346 RepID=UPI0009FF9230|nr:polysaccharide biosynthesis tyrosine autokinase [Demequina sp. NBRC 110057]
MDIQEYLKALRKSWIIIVAFTVLGTALGVTFGLVATPTYTASSKVFVSTSHTDSVSDLQQGNSFTTQRVATYIDLIHTTAVLQPTAEALGIDISTSGLREMIFASAPINTSVIDITATNEDPAFAASLATETARSLIALVEEIEANDSTAESPIRLSLVEEASVPDSPTSPRLPLNIAVGFIIGLSLGVGTALARRALDTRVHNEFDVESMTSAPVVGGIVYDAKASEVPLAVSADPHSPRAESFRTMRSNLQFLDAGRHRTFVVTSALPGEGKSTTAANLAIALADAGARVLLVGADLRKPRMAEYMGIEGGLGLTDVLVGHVALADATQRWGRTDLHLLPAGAVPPNPSELLGSTAMAELIEHMQAEYDAVLFDGAPILPVTDSAVLARLAGGTLVLCAAGRTKMRQLEGALGALENVGAPVSGIALTMLPTKGPDAHGYGRYGYASVT